jgi:hypothetical protein
METRSVTGPGQLSELAEGSFEIAFGKDKLLLDASSEELLPLDRAKLRKLLGTVRVTAQQLFLEGAKEPANSFVRLERPTSTYVVDLGKLKPTTVTWVRNTLLMQGMEAM